MHGNEFAGAIVLDRLLRADFKPKRGKISFVFGNLAAFARFDPKTPTQARFIDEDMNRLWDETVFNGPRQSIELNRARELLPLIDEADLILDLHSMLWPSSPLILCGSTARGRALGGVVRCPAMVVADVGHANGTRLIDFHRFSKTGTAAVLVEAGQHWRPETIATTMASVSFLLQHFDIVDASIFSPPQSVDESTRFAEVTDVITVRTAAFSFLREWRGGEVISRRNTLIALDGLREIRTPYDDCLLVMPSSRPGKGHTAVRLAKFVA
jgi:predicted deacylase